MSMPEALRTEIRRVLDEGEFTIQVATRIERLASAARNMLAAAGGVAEAIAKVKDDQDNDANPLVPSQAAETFGARLIQEAMAAIPALFRQQSSPEALVHALVSARVHGMTDVAAELERKLVGRPLDGERPVLQLDANEQPHVSQRLVKVDDSSGAGNGADTSNSVNQQET